MRNRAFHILCAALVCITCSSTTVRATSCHQVDGIAGGAEGSESVSLQFTYQFARMDRYKTGSDTLSLDEAKAYIKPDGATYTSLPISMDMVRYTMTAGYAFSSRFQAFISLPHVRNTMDMTSSLGAMLGWQDMTMAPTSGVGDAVLMGLYRLNGSQETEQTGAVSVGLGVKAPTGSSTERYDNGRLVHFHMQPGTGSWDPLLTVKYTTKAAELLTLQADAAYHYTTSNREGYEAGDSASLGLAGRYVLMKALGISAGLTYVHTGKASDRNGRYYNAATNSSLMDDPANTGGDSLWFSPGLQAFPVKNLALEAGVKLPLWENVNGIQLVARSIVSAGIAYRF
ncbi:MAG: transporter [Nitrospirota bacterium]